MSDPPCSDVAALTLGDDAPTGTIIEPADYSIPISAALMSRYIETRPDGDCLYTCFIGIASASRTLKLRPTDDGRPFTVEEMRGKIADEMKNNKDYYIPNYWDNGILSHMLRHGVVRSEGGSGLDGWRFTQTYLNDCVRMTPDEARAKGENPQQTWGGNPEIDAFAQITGLVVRVYQWGEDSSVLPQSKEESRLAFIARPRNAPEGDPIECNLVQSANHFEYIRQEPPLEVFHYLTTFLRADGTRPPIRKADDAAPPPDNEYNNPIVLRADGLRDVGLLSRAGRQQQQPGQPAAPVVDPEAAKRVKEQQAKDIAARRKREKEKEAHSSSWIVAGARSEAHGSAQGPRRHYRSIAEIHRRARERQATEDEQYMQLVAAYLPSKQPRQ